MWNIDSESNEHLQLVKNINNMNLPHQIRNNAWSKITELNLPLTNSRPSMRDEIRELSEINQSSDVGTRKWKRFGYKCKFWQGQ